MDDFILHSKFQKANREAKVRHDEMRPFMEGMKGFFQEAKSIVEINKNLMKVCLLLTICSSILQVIVIAELAFRR